MEASAKSPPPFLVQFLLTEALPKNKNKRPRSLQSPSTTRMFCIKVEHGVVLQIRPSLNPILAQGGPTPKGCGRSDPPPEMLRKLAAAKIAPHHSAVPRSISPKCLVVAVSGSDGWTAVLLLCTSSSPCRICLVSAQQFMLDIRLPFCAVGLDKDGAWSTAIRLTPSF